MYPSGKEFFPKAEAGDSLPESSTAHVRNKAASFAEMFPTTPAGIVNPSPKSFAQSHPVLLTGLMDPEVDNTRAESALQVGGWSALLVVGFLLGRIQWRCC